MNNGVERRDFIKRCIAAGVTTAAASANILGANDRVRVGVIGPGRQGRVVMKTFMRNADAQIVALCDVFQPQMDFAIKDANTTAWSRSARSSAPAIITRRPPRSFAAGN